MPLVMDDVKVATHEKEWKCTNTLASLNLGMTLLPAGICLFHDLSPHISAISALNGLM